jgi:hypothetical protein
MVLIKCPACGSKVSSQDTTCPACAHLLSPGQAKPAATNWTKIYIAAVFLLNFSVLFLVVTGERRKVFWLLVAVMALMTFVLAKLKVKRTR